MKKNLFLAILAFASFIAFGQKANKYPVAPMDTTQNTYHDSITINDPYQWMENPEDPRLTVWLEEQKRLTDKLSHQQVRKNTLHAQLASIFHNYESDYKDDELEKKEEEDIVYEFKIEASESKKSPDLYFRKRGTSNYRYLLRAKDLVKDKSDRVEFTHFQVSPSLSKASVEVSINGSDWRTVYFFDLLTGAQLGDTLHNLRNKNHLVWVEDGLYYMGYKKPEKGREQLDKACGQALYYHKLGTPQASDVMLYQNPDTTGTYSFSYSSIDSTTLFFNHIYFSRGKTYNAKSYVDVSNPQSFLLKNILLYPANDSLNFSYCAHFGDTIILMSTSRAPNGKIFLANINKVNQVEELVPEFDIPLLYANRLGADKLACMYRNDGLYLALIYDLKGELLRRIEFPEGKSVRGLYESDKKAEKTNFWVTSFFHPPLLYELSLSDLTYKPMQTLRVPYNPNDVETRFVNYKSKDGTEIPMYITYRKDIKLNGNNPTLIYGYGGYGTRIEPNFNPSNALWVLHGGILAIPNIRGGGEEGSEWGKQGRRLQKQNAFEDFIAAAEFLIKEKYTNPEKIAIKGASHGGLLVGAAITQRPDLFKVAIAEAGVFDMLRFGEYTVGGVLTNIKEFGTVDIYEDFENMRSYSPLHRIKEGVKYPNVLFITGEKDDRVPPLHSYKFLAALQEKGDPTSLYHMYIVPGSGHGGALTSTDFTNKTLYEYYFLFDQLGVRFY
ncbi:MAG: prolyl oligopeptidase family serine peptidase [Tenuifilaceae bacterium]|jgi:prolyl oligopeptidase|nr:prolyl oligopeptidase family serine peptidase [Tenuifilaceae bacterium]